jgi:hypothetical protein
MTVYRKPGAQIYNVPGLGLVQLLPDGSLELSVQPGADGVRTAVDWAAAVLEGDPGSALAIATAVRAAFATEP